MGRLNLQNARLANQAKRTPGRLKRILLLWMPKGEVIGSLKVHIQNKNEYFLMNLKLRRYVKGLHCLREFFIDSDRILTD